jgi:pimeloyl-ACP methyl ester carboxylesterase
VDNPTYCDPAGYCPSADDNRDLGGPGFDLWGGGADLAGTRPDLARHDLGGGEDMDMGGGGSFDPGSPGPDSTVSFDLRVTLGRDTVSLTVIGPSDDGKGISMRGAPHPLVLLSPGFTIDRKEYASYATRLATYGLVAVLQNSPQEFNHATYRDDTIALLTWLGAPTGRDAGRLLGRVDLTRAGLAGHSLGGKISILVAAKDARVKALFGIDPVDANTPPALPEIGKIKLPTGVPLAMVGETTSKSGGMPCTPAAGNYEALYAKANSPALAITVVSAAHDDFVDNFAGCPTCRFCPGGSAPKDRTNQLAVKYLTAYFVGALLGDARARAYFTGAAFQKDVTDGYVTQVAK